jgi:hypothetical protein
MRYMLQKIYSDIQRRESVSDEREEPPVEGPSIPQPFVAVVVAYPKLSANTYKYKLIKKI